MEFGRRITIRNIEKLKSKFVVPNSALLSVDLVNSLKALEERGTSATPVEFHALASVAEAVALHERIYAFSRSSGMPQALERLTELGVVVPITEAKFFEDDLRLRDEDDLASSLLWPAQFEPILFRRLSDRLGRVRRLLELEGKIGLAQLAEIGTTPDCDLFGEVLDEDLERLALELELTQGFYATARVLDLEYYPGLFSLPYLLSTNATERKLSLMIYDRLVAEFSDGVFRSLCG